ncbi:helix-turn-helix domain-containing protein [Photorhabdus bodei]|uniref:Transcriptional regulator n=1 Tax=Photorhabdus bodei TaxID=2029681 RepID=A0A329WW00_9GAMM|nr:helix-turn-helix transcriptional regulator [Photorhabdus bodei]RAX07648.1 transcriptional regulator [Photorhabdus bodei]
MNFDSLCATRLKKERKRLSLKQDEAAQMCGVSREMWSKYERGVAVPGGDVWVAFALAGANVQFILTGISSSNVVLSPDESELVQYYRQAPLALKVAAVAALQSGLSNVSSTKQKITGNGNRIAGRDYNEHKK